MELFLKGGCNIAGEDDSYDFGTGAGFYVDATEEKWKTNYRMYSYITKEVRGSLERLEMVLFRLPLLFFLSIIVCLGICGK